jgi:hypothetical protein
VGNVVGAKPATGAGLVARLAGHLSAPEKAAVLVLSSPRNAEELYTFADTLEIAILKGTLSGRVAPSAC